MKHKVAELEGALLDAAVAMALSRTPGYSWGRNESGVVVLVDQAGHVMDPFEPSSDWSIGGPLLHEHGIGVERYKPDSMDAGDPLVSDGRWMWVTDKSCGPTPLIAAMRAYCASVFGDEVEIP